MYITQSNITQITTVPTIKIHTCQKSEDSYCSWYVYYLIPSRRCRAGGVHLFRKNWSPRRSHTRQRKRLSRDVDACERQWGSSRRSRRASLPSPEISVNKNIYTDNQTAGTTPAATYNISDNKILTPSTVFLVMERKEKHTIITSNKVIICISSPLLLLLTTRKDTPKIHVSGT